MKKINKKILLIGFLIGIVSFFYITNFPFADDFGLKETKSVSGINVANDMTTVEGITSRILGTALTFLSLVFFGLIVFGGGRWMLARGNSDEIGKAQDTVIMAVIGLVIILGANALVNFVFTSVGTGSPQVSYSSPCQEAHPGWELLGIRECAGNNYQRKILNIEDCVEKNNCDSNTSEFFEEGFESLVCCLPYKSKCARSYEGYDCIADSYDCDLGTTKKQIGLCDSDTEDEAFCCQSSEVWCLDAEWNTDKTLKEFNCEKQFGQCVNEIGVLTAKSYNFNSVQECRQIGELLDVNK